MKCKEAVEGLVYEERKLCRIRGPKKSQSPGWEGEGDSWENGSGFVEAEWRMRKRKVDGRWAMDEDVTLADNGSGTGAGCGFLPGWPGLLDLATRFFF